MKKIYADSFIEAVFNGETPKLAGDIYFQAVFMMGLSGSGKSYVKARKYLQHTGFVDIDPDEIKKTHPKFNAERPFEVHEWSKDIADSMFNAVIKTGDPFVLDGTGTSPNKMAAKMESARSAGYRIFLVYVYTPFEISIWRNRNRSRFVPESVIMEKAKEISGSFAYLKTAADKVKVVINFEESERGKALADMEIYPPPFEMRPPRPNSPEYEAKKSGVKV